MFTTFLHEIEALVPLLIRALIHKVIVHSVSERQSREWKQSISTSAKSPKN